MSTLINTPVLGFIGFGEAAFHISSGLYEEGVKGIVAFDIMATNPQMGPLVRERAAGAHVTLLTSLKEMLEKAEVIFCATSAKSALAIARETQPFLREGQLYADINSASPQVKREIGAIVAPTGALFVDTAVMALVPQHRHKVPMAVSGTGARRFADLLSPCGMDITYINDRAGSSSAIKMLRSIFIKGLAALLFEALTASRKAGVEREIMESIRETIEEQPFEQLASLLLTRNAVSAERRVAEMGEVISCIEEMGLDSSASRATRAKLQNFVEMDLKTRLGHKPPAHYTEVLDAIIELSEKKEP
jgi:3-hydroxyisobutyrate dehydrogenase-like beta-hydroxyacid dehydrogenase